MNRTSSFFWRARSGSMDTDTNSVASGSTTGGVGLSIDGEDSSSLHAQQEPISEVYQAPSTSSNIAPVQQQQQHPPVNVRMVWPNDNGHSYSTPSIAEEAEGQLSPQQQQEHHQDDQEQPLLQRQMSDVGSTAASATKTINMGSAFTALNQTVQNQQQQQHEVRKRSQSYGSMTMAAGAPSPRYVLMTPPTLNNTTSHMVDSNNNDHQPYPNSQPGAASSGSTSPNPALATPMTSNSRKRFNHSGSVVRGNQTIRFQVVVWYVGAIDVVQSHVMMRFRVTLFWNDDKLDEEPTPLQRMPSSVWTMRGRMNACQEEVHNDAVRKMVDVPPVSILNAVSFETVGKPEVELIQQDTNLMRWSCMYNATLFQGDNMRVEQFPHDSHELVLKLGILANRRRGQRWDKRKWRLALATAKDSQGTTRVPHGLLVDHVSIPDFKCQRDLQFEFSPMPMGQSTDTCLQVKLHVVRESRHYDRNIMPLLALLNIVAISCLVRNFASATASTETMLSIAFVEVGIRLTIDSRLPSVGYQIKIQSVLNQCFFLLCALVLETNFVFWLVKKRGWSVPTTDWIDFYVAVVALAYTANVWMYYYHDWKLIPILDL